MNNGELTAKQDRFCEEFLVDLNATQAAKRAGYSPRSAASIGEENMKKPQILKRIHRLQINRSLRTRIKADRIVEELAKIAFAKDGVKTSDRIKALGMLGKHVGLFEKQNNQYTDKILENYRNETWQRLDEPFLNTLSLKTKQKLLIAIRNYSKEN